MNESRITPAVIPVLTLLSALVCCDRLQESNPLLHISTGHNSITMKAGDAWLYRHAFISERIDPSLKIPDTITGYSYFSAGKDTIINAETYLLIEGRDYEIAKDTIHIRAKRFAIHLADTIKMYEFKTDGNGSLSGIMRGDAGNPFIRNDAFGTMALKETFMRRIFSATRSDTSALYDFVYPVVFPLAENAVFVYRDSGNSMGHLTVRKKFLGVDTITVPAGRYAALKLQYLTNEYLPGTSIVLYDWIGRYGAIKKYQFVPDIIITDETGSNLDTCDFTGIEELIGSSDIDPDTLEPWGEKPEARSQRPAK